MLSEHEYELVGTTSALQVYLGLPRLLGLININDTPRRGWWDFVGKQGIFKEQPSSGSGVTQAWPLSPDCNQLRWGSAAGARHHCKYSVCMNLQSSQ